MPKENNLRSSNLNYKFSIIKTNNKKQNKSYQPKLIKNESNLKDNRNSFKGNARLILIRQELMPIKRLIKSKRIEFNILKLCLKSSINLKFFIKKKPEKC